MPENVKNKNCIEYRKEIIARSLLILNWYEFLLQYYETLNIKHSHVKPLPSSFFEWAIGFMSIIFEKD